MGKLPHRQVQFDPFLGVELATEKQEDPQAVAVRQAFGHKGGALKLVSIQPALTRTPGAAFRQGLRCPV
jgi:hypothetical protein